MGTNQGTGAKTFGVQVGLFRRYENAEYLMNQLEAQGYSVQIRDWNGYYSVVVGNESSLDAARRLEKELQKKGYSTLIVNI